jgi:queuine tRNA-ribosyltransferase
VKEGHWLRFNSPYDNHRLSIKKACFADDPLPVMPDCTCYTCKNYSRAALHHLCKQKAPVFTALASIHNISVMHDVCATMRAFIDKERA